MSSPFARTVRIPTLLALAATLPVVAPTVLAQDVQPLDDLRRTAEQLVAQRLNQGGGATAHVTAGAVDGRLRLARCTKPLEGVMPATMREGARMTIGIRCPVPTWTVYVPVNIETEMKVLVLRQAAARHASLTAADVEVQSRRVPGVAAGYLTDVSQLSRRHLKLPAGPGTALTQELFAADVLIRRGQRVTLVVSAGGLEIRAQGEAIADAAAGGRVRVLNLSSRQIVEGQAESADQVRVSL